MATHDYNLTNQSGADFRADLNNALSAILSNNASATEPTTTTAYMLWVDTTNNLLKMRNSADNAWITLPVSITSSNTVDIDGGTVNTITSLSFSSGETVTTILDEDDLSSDDASALATQQSIKAYVDSQVTAQDLDFQGDTGGALSIDLDSETFTISGGNGIDTSGALNTLTIAIDSSVVTLTDTQTLTNKTIDADNNTISNLEVDNLKSGVLDTDLTSVSASDDTLASSKAIKTYVDSQVTAQDLDLTDGTTSISIDLDSETLSVLGGTGVTSTASGNGVTLAIGQDVGTTADVTFNTVSADLTGDVTGTVSSLANHDTDDLAEGTNLYYTQARFDSAFSGKSTSDLTEGTNLYFTDERVDDRVNNLLVAGSNVTLTYDDVANTLTIAATEDNLSNNTTDDLAEGSTNLYFTNARARAAISVSGDLAYNSTTGVVSFTERTDAEVRGLVSASGDLSYNSTTGVFSFTERTDAEVRGLISGGTGVTYNNTTGVISIGQAVSTTSDVTFNDVIVSGDLTVSGTTTTVNTETINLADNIILFNSNTTGTPTENAGIEIERGDATNKTLLWNETDDKWTVGSETFVAATFEGALTGNVTGTVSSLSNHDTGDLAEGSNLYYTTARFDSAFGGKTTSDLTEGTNLYYTTARFDTAFSGKDTDDLTEGATNLYYTTARANSDFDTRLATKSTSDLSEGTNLYYTDTRFDTRLATKTTDNLTEGSTNLYYADSLVDSHLSGGTGVTYSGGTISIGQAVGTGDSVTFAGVSSDFTGDIDGAVKFTAKADVALTKGQVVYISGISGDVPTVNLADADNSSAMPAFGLVYANANQNASVEIITFGSLSGFDTSGFSVGDTVYVSTTAGSLTATPPTGESSLIQNIGIVQRSHASAGIIKVGGAGRTNATPNLNSGKIFYGNGSNQSVPTTLDTSIVPENTNLYYTDSRFDTRLASKSTSDLSEGTNLYYTTARFDSAFSGKSTSDLSEGTNLYYTDERVDDRVANLLTAGSNVTLTYDDVAGTLTIAATEDNLSNNDTDDLAEGSTNLYFTTARARSSISATGDISYNSTTGVISFTATSGVTSVNSQTGTVVLDTDDISEGVTNLYFTDERVDDRVNALLTAGTGITLTYDDGANTLTIAGSAQYGDSDVESYLDTNGLTLPDNVKAQFGASNDLQIYHNNSSYIENNTGSLVLRNYADDSDILLYSDDGAGGTTLYIQADGSNGEVRLYHYGTEKFNTLSTGVEVTGNITVSGTVDGRDLATDGTKLDGIESGATADQTASEILTLIKTVDGAGSGLDADTLDGISSASFLRSDADDTLSGNLTVTGNLTVQGTTTTLETATLNVEDKNITINYSTGDSSGSANGAGITIQDAVNSTTDATILWDATNDEFDFSHAINVTGNISTSGTVDGRDIASDGSKLDGIESGATADQTAAEILTAIKTVDGAGSGLDADLLDGLSSASFLRADATDTATGTLNFATTNHALITVDTNGGTSGVADEFRIGADNYDTGTAFSGVTIRPSDNVNPDSGGTLLMVRSGGGSPRFFVQHSGILGSTNTDMYLATNTDMSGGNRVFHDGYHPNADKWTTARTITLGGDLTGNVSIDGSANVTLTAAVVDDSHNHIISNVDGLQTALDAKLDSSSYTAADVLAKIKTVDGAGSGLDADLLDGISSGSFIRKDADTTITNTAVEVSFYSADVMETATGDQATLEVYQDTANADAFMQFHIGGDYAAYFGLKGDINDFAVGGWSMGANYYRVWHAGNDGAGSGLDADLLDGQHGSYYATASSLGSYLPLAGGTMTGNLTMSGASIYPATDNTGQVGNSTNTWNFGHFTNFQVDSTLTVRAYIDLADSDGIRWGSSDDYRMFYNGTTNYMNFEMEAANNGLIFTDNGTTRYTFAKAGTLSLETNGNNTVGGNIRLGSTQNNSTKFTSITSREYTNDTETEGFTIIGSVATTERSVIIGGGYLEQNSANKIKFYTTSGTARTGTEVMTIDPSGKVGIATTTTTPAAGLHIAKYGTAGEDCLKVEGQVRLEGQGRTRLTITAANAASSNKMWNLDNDSGTLRFFNEDYSSSGVGASGVVYMSIPANGLVRINSAFTNQTVATHRDVWAEDNGELGYNSSVRASKMNIEDVTDASWLYSVNPKTFYRRKRDENGNYLEENDGIREYGFIAEDIEEHAPELCFYDVEREKDIDGNIIDGGTFTQTDLAGIHYSQLTAPMLKLIQEQKQLIDDLTARIEILENA